MKVAKAILTFPNVSREGLTSFLRARPFVLVNYTLSDGETFSSRGETVSTVLVAVNIGPESPVWFRARVMDIAKEYRRTVSGSQGLISVEFLETDVRLV